MPNSDVLEKLLRAPPACPRCQAVLDQATPAGAAVVEPAPGDITVCVYCEAVLRFNTQFGLDEVSADEIRQMSPADQAELARVLRSVRRLKLDMGRAWPG